MDYRPIIRNLIINQERPFYASDILNALHNIGFYDDNMIITVLDELVQERAIIFDKVFEDRDGSFGFGYVSLNSFDIKNTTKRPR